MPLSQRIAELLFDWLPSVLQGIETWMSSQSIDAGTYWHKEITDNLHQSRDGIIVVTAENQKATWLNYEAGALAQSVTTRDGNVIPLLVDLKIAELEGPMNNLHVKVLDEAGVMSVLRVLNAHASPSLGEKSLEREFQLKWPALKESVEQAIRELGSTVYSIVDPVTPEPDFSIEFVGAAKAYHCDPHVLEEYLEGQRSILMGDFPRGGRVSGVLEAMTMADEDREEQEFRSTIDQWTADVRRCWPHFLDGLVAAVWDGVHIRISNRSARFVDKPEFVTTLAGPIDVVEKGDKEDWNIYNFLPKPPRPWGPRKKYELSIPESYFNVGSMPSGGYQSLTWERDATQLQIVLRMDELRSHKTVDCDEEFVLILRTADLPDKLEATWTATGRDMHQMHEGAMAVSVSPGVDDITDRLRHILDLRG